MIGYEELLALRCPHGEFAWNDRDVMLYALAIGFGRDPLDPAELPFIYEHGLKVAPSFATVAAWGSNPPILQAGIDYSRLVHAAQAVVVHHPLPAAARVRAEGGIVRAIDKGDKGALIEGEALLRDAATGVAYVTNRVTWLARADGHFGGPRVGEAPAHCMPARAPDVTIRQTTRPDQAALYRLLGDRNPLHIDPAVAAAAGFDRPILHGLCTFGIACRAVLQACAELEPARIASIGMRFSAPVLPGDEVTVDLWQDGAIVSFEAAVRARAAIVVRHGCAVLR